MYNVSVFHNNELVVVFGAKNVATFAPGNMTKNYPALGKFKDSFMIRDTDIYEYENGQVTVQRF